MTRKAASPPLAPGLGPKSQAMLAAAGITSVAQLRALGAVQAYLRVRQAGGSNASLNLLWGLEAALTGEDWRVVARVHRTRLLLALEDALEDAREDAQDPAP
jgi:DNA transformation protein and related proteins